MAKGKRNKNQREADAKRRPDDVVWAKSFDSADYLDPRPGRMPRPYDRSNCGARDRKDEVKRGFTRFLRPPFTA